MEWPIIILLVAVSMVVGIMVTIMKYDDDAERQRRIDIIKRREERRNGH